MSQTPKAGSQPYEVLKHIWRAGPQMYVSLARSFPMLSRTNWYEIVAMYGLTKHPGMLYSVPEYLARFYEEETKPVPVKYLGEIVPSREPKPFKPYVPPKLSLREPLREGFSVIASGTSAPAYRDL